MQFPYPKWSRGKYQKFSANSDLSEEEQSLTGKDYEGYRLAHSGYSSKSWMFAKAISVYTIVAANILLFLSSAVMIWKSSGSSQCSEKEVSAYSPIYDRLDIYRTETHHNFSNYWPDNEPSIFQQPPSPEVDAAWFRISNQQSIALSEEDVRRLGYDPATVWPAPKDEFGEGVWYGVPDVFHQIHCLNMLRRTSWPEYYGDLREENKHAPLKWEDHLLHCQYVVLRSLMCHADLEIMVGQKFKGWPGLNMNFATTKKCRNFQEIVEWHEDAMVVQKAPWSEYPDRPIIEQDPEGVLTPYGNHMGLEEWADSQNIQLDIPSDMAWQPKEPHHRHASHLDEEASQS